MPLLPYQSSEVTSDQNGSLRVIGLNDGKMDQVISALSSENARTILSQIYENPETASEIADETDNSVQTVSYHLQNLEEAGLITVAGTRYSEKGAEMNIYAPVDEPMVVFVGTKKREAGFMELLKRIIGAIGVLSISSGLLYLYRGFGRSAGGTTHAPGVFDIPGVEFFLGGMFLLLVFTLWQVRMQYRSS